LAKILQRWDDEAYYEDEWDSGNIKTATYFFEIEEKSNEKHLEKSK
jgi:hypothetical protein